MSTTKSDGYQSFLLMLLAVVIVVTLLGAVVAFCNVDITPNLQSLFNKLNDTGTTPH